MNSYTLRNVTRGNIGEVFYQLIRYETDNFIQKDISKTSLFRYLLNYLVLEHNGLNVKTIIRENKYTCLNYLDDYANYYARCYTQYEKHCRRIHFFSEVFTEKDFTEMLHNPQHSLWGKYEGCMVIKPLPKGIFGITYLNTYKNQNKEKNRYYTSLSHKKINLFGHELEIKTMPFKEQDGIVASCATTALWMAFQKTSELFNTKAPSLSEITILAGDKYLNSGKIFPSKGLEVNQVCKAINKIGLISELRTELFNENLFKGYVYAYLRGEIPVLLGLRFPSNDDHLVTINGYRFGKSSKNIKNISDNIERLYVHDDQIGPFARLIINDRHDPDFKTDEVESIYNFDLTTSWWKKEKLHEWIKKNNFPTETPTFKKSDFENAKPAYIIIPLAPTIKVTYEDIFEQQGFISFIMNFFTDIGKHLVWDIFLMKSNKYKKWLIDRFQQKNNKQFEYILQQSLPQYIWVIQAWTGDKLLFDFIYDTIELNKTGQPVAINVYEERLLNDFRDKTKIEKICSACFFIDEYKTSILRTFNEIPYDLKETMQFLLEKPNEKVFTDLDLFQLWNYETQFKIPSKPNKEKLLSDELGDLFTQRTNNKLSFSK